MIKMIFNKNTIFGRLNHALAPVLYIALCALIASTMPCDDEMGFWTWFVMLLIVLGMAIFSTYHIIKGIIKLVKWIIRG